MKTMSENVATVRGLMKAAGRERIWNNKGKTMRSVKCYLPTNPKVVQMLIDGINQELEGENFSIKITDGRSSWGAFKAFIVRFPY